MGATASPVWVGRCVPYVFPPNDPLFSQPWAQQAVEEAFDLWSAPQCTDLLFVNADVEGAVVLMSLDENDPLLSESIAISTETQFDINTGAIVAARILVNTRDYRFARLTADCEEPNSYDLKVALAAEITRLIGLNHDRVEGTLAARQDLACSIDATLGEEDREGVCALYPVGAPVNPCVPPSEDYKEEHIYSCGTLQSGAPCADDLQCPDLHRCRAGSCQLILQSRGCACSQTSAPSAPEPNNKPWSWLALWVLGFIRAKSSRRFLHRSA